MPGENIYDWSITAANNATYDSSINWAESQPRASVNNSARSMMAALAKNRDLQNGSIVTGGTANAQTFTSSVGYSPGPIPTGLRVLLKIGPGLTNTTAATLDMDGIGAVAIKTEAGTDLTAGLLTAGTYEEFRYDGTNWILLGFSGTLPATTINGNLTVTDTINNSSGLANLGNVVVAGNETVAGSFTVSGTATSSLGVINVSPVTSFGCALKVGHEGAATRYGIGIRAALDNTYNILFTNSVDTVIGSISNAFGTVTSFNTTCDGNLKTAIEDLPPVGGIIDALRPVKFKWKTQMDAGDWTGFIAQEAHKVAPQTVTPARDGAPWMMDYSKLVPMLVAELKSLRKRIAELEKR